MNSKHSGAGNLSLRIPNEVAALIPALQLREPSTALLKTLSNHEWSELLAFCDLAHLTLTLAQLPTDGFPDWVAERLNTNVIDNIRRFKRVKATCKEAAEALSAAGVEHVVIEGLHSAQTTSKLPSVFVCNPISIYIARQR